MKLTGFDTLFALLIGLLVALAVYVRQPAPQYSADSATSAVVEMPPPCPDPPYDYVGAFNASAPCVGPGGWFPAANVTPPPWTTSMNYRTITIADQTIAICFPPEMDGGRRICAQAETIARLLRMVQ